MDNNQPIIVKRVKRFAAGHHGGAWKIAFADFATAMMAFFLVLWLLSSATPAQLKAVSGYFQDPVGFTEGGSPYAVDLGGTPTVAPDKTLNPKIDTPDVSLNAENAEAIAEKLEKERLELLLHELQNKVKEDPELRNFKDQIQFDITPDGLRIQIRDAENRPMFSLGSAQLQPYFEDILLAMSATLRSVPNKLSVSGHTDAKPYAKNAAFSNWELSSNRANAARRALVVGGYPEDQVARVVGYSSTALFDRKSPLSPVNRRIEILVLNKRAQQAIDEEQATQSGADAPTPSPTSGQTPARPTGGVAPVPRGPQGQAAPAGPAAELQNRLNAFESGVFQFRDPQQQQR